MFTKWHEVEDWISDNNIKKWVFTKTNPMGKEANAVDNGVIVSTTNWDKDENNPMDMSRKLDLTKKYLEQYGERVFGIGYSSANGTRGGLYCEVCLSSAQTQQQPVGFAPQIPAGAGSVDEAALTERIKKELRLEYDQRDFERERQAFEDEKKQFNADKAGVIGFVVDAFKPYLPALSGLSKQNRMVAGLDGEDMEAAKIRPVNPNPEAPADGEPQDPEQEDIFTDEESDKLFELMARFKKAEPDNYLKLLERMVEMAETGDVMYATAKNFLLK